MEVQVTAWKVPETCYMYCCVRARRERGDFEPHRDLGPDMRLRVEFLSVQVWSVLVALGQDRKLTSRLAVGIQSPPEPQQSESSVEGSIPKV